MSSNQPVAGISRSIRASRSSTEGKAGNDSFTGHGVDAVTVSAEGPIRRQRADQQRRRAAEPRQRDLPERRALDERRRRNVDAAQEFAGFEIVAERAFDEIDHGNLPLAAVRRPDGADTVERGGERNHGACRQRHAQIAANRRHVPDLERCQKRAAALINQRRRGPFDRRGDAVELRDGAGTGDFEAGRAHAQRLPAELGQIDKPAEFGLRLGKQPGAAADPGIARAPLRQRLARLRLRPFGDGVQIQDTLLARLWS